MILPKGGGERGHFGGPLDVLLIQHDLSTRLFHVAVYEERPLPGPLKPVGELKTVRLKSKMHRTEGAETLEEAREHLTDLATKIEVPEGNVWKDTYYDVPQAGPDVIVVPNWTLDPAPTG